MDIEGPISMFLVSACVFQVCFMMFRPFHYVSCLRLWACALCDVSCCFIFRRSAIVGVPNSFSYVCPCVSIPTALVL